MNAETGVLINVATMEKRVQYYLAMEEVKRLSNWLTNWTKDPAVPTTFMRNLRRSLEP